MTVASRPFPPRPTVQLAKIRERTSAVSGSPIGVGAPPPAKAPGLTQHTHRLTPRPTHHIWVYPAAPMSTIKTQPSDPQALTYTNPRLTASRSCPPAPQAPASGGPGGRPLHRSGAPAAKCENTYPPYSNYPPAAAGAEREPIQSTMLPIHPPTSPFNPVSHAPWRAPEKPKKRQPPLALQGSPCRPPCSSCQTDRDDVGTTLKRQEQMAPGVPAMSPQSSVRSIRGPILCLWCAPGDREGQRLIYTSMLWPLRATGSAKARSVDSLPAYVGVRCGCSRTDVAIWWRPPNPCRRLATPRRRPKTPT